MKTKTIIIMRHAAACHEGFLTKEAFAEMAELGKFLATAGIIEAGSTAFLCSDKLRAIKTVQAIMRGAGAHEMKSFTNFDFELVHKELFSLEERCDVPGAIRVIKTYLDKAKTIIIATHLEMMEKLPYEFGKTVLDTEAFPSYGRLNHGEGVAIDCLSKTCVMLESLAR